jgi:hypothetical protein
MNKLIYKFWMTLAWGLGILATIGIMGITYAMIFQNARVDFVIG